MLDFASLDIQSIDDLRRFEARHPLAEFAELTTYDLIRQKADAAPDALSLIYLPSGEANVEPVRWTRAGLMQAIHQTANAFHGLGVGPTDVVSFMLPNILQVQPVFWGSQATGIVNPVNFLLDVDQISRILDLTKCKVLVVPGPSISPEIWQKALVLREKISSLRALVVIGGHAETAPDIFDYEVICGAASGDHLVSGRQIRPDDIATIFHTSGSTGHPKLVPHTHRNEVAAAIQTAILFGFSQDDVINNGMPMFHVAAPMLLSLAPLAVGAQIFMPTAAGMRSPLVLRNFWHFIERFRITVPGGVPTSLLELSQIPVGGTDLSSVRFFMTGGAPLSSGLAEGFENHSGKPLRQIYGMTETAGVIAGSPPAAMLPADQIGYCAPYMQISVRRYAADGSYRECSAGHNGEIYVRGANVAAQLDDGADGWLATGDIGSVCGAGVLSISGRSKDVIIRSGHNIDPAMIEEAVNRHPAVMASVAVGLPDQRAGEVPIVFVTTHEDIDANPDEILTFAQAHVAEKPAKPVRIVVVDAFPMNAVGKIFRPKLRCIAVETIVVKEVKSSKIGDYCNYKIDTRIDEYGVIMCEVSIFAKTGRVIDSNIVHDMMQAIESDIKKYNIQFAMRLFC